MADTLPTRLTDLLAPVVSEAGLFLEGIETTKAGKYSVVRVIVDLPDGPGDVDLDTLAEVTRVVSDVLDDADPIKGQYTLEVTSPGAQRDLTTPRHFRRAVGHDVELTTAEGVLTGSVREATDTALALETDGAKQTIAYAQISQARMVVVF